MFSGIYLLTTFSGISVLVFQFSSDLRERGHPFQLPDHYTDLHKKSFIVRSLYQYIK